MVLTSLALLDDVSQMKFSDSDNSNDNDNNNTDDNNDNKNDDTCKKDL